MGPSGRVFAIYNNVRDLYDSTAMMCMIAFNQANSTDLTANMSLKCLKYLDVKQVCNFSILMILQAIP